MSDKRCEPGRHVWEAIGDSLAYRCQCGAFGVECNECGGIGHLYDDDGDNVDCPAAGCVDGVVESGKE